MDLDRQLIKRVKGLKLKMSDKPQPELLIRIPNTNQEVDYDVHVETKEFTSLCPLSLSQPDYATIVVDYAPKYFLVELKSYKFYLVSYRMTPVFHEMVPAMILADLVELLDPKEMTVTGYFTTRGGIDTTVRAYYTKESKLEESQLH